MSWLIALSLIHMSMMSSKVLHDFNFSDNLTDWTIINDGVMGGLSKGAIALSEEGHGVFSGYISLANNGGFSSVRKRFESVIVVPYQKIVIRVKGDGKRYQLRLKTSASDAHSYINYFDTSGEWEEIVFDLVTFYPTFRGRKLTMPNYPKKTLEELAILIGNKKAESFCLEIDYVILK